MRGERIRQSQMRRQLRTEHRRTKDIEGTLVPCPGRRGRPDRLSFPRKAWSSRRLRKAFGGHGIAAQCAHGGLITAGRAAHSQIDRPDGESPGAELFGDDQRCVMGSMMPPARGGWFRCWPR